MSWGDPLVQGLGVGGRQGAGPRRTRCSGSRGGQGTGGGRRGMWHHWEANASSERACTPACSPAHLESPRATSSNPAVSSKPHARRPQPG